MNMTAHHEGRRIVRPNSLRMTVFGVLCTAAVIGSGGIALARPSQHLPQTLPCEAVAGADAYSTPQDVPLVVGAPGVMANDTPCGGIVSVHILPQHGALNLQSDGSFVYTPNPGYSGPDAFVYSLLSGAAAPPANVQITVEPAPVCEPVAIDDAYETQPDTVLNVGLPGVKANDTHCDFFVHLYSNPDHGTLTLNADGTFLYTPDAGSTGVDSFEYALAANMPGFVSSPGRGLRGGRPQGAADNVATVTITVATAPTTTVPPTPTAPTPPGNTLPATR